MTNKEIEYDPCKTCGYAEGSPFCLQYCPYDAERKKEQKSCDDISPTAVPVTVEEAKRLLQAEWKKEVSKDKSNSRLLVAYKMAVQLLKQEPCDDIAQERYKDLCEYFGGAKDILKSREDFKAWLGRVKWHIRKAEELYEKYEYKKEPCDDAISRDAVLDALLDYWHDIQFVDGSGYDVYEDCKAVIDELPSVTQKSGKWIPVSERLPEEFESVLVCYKSQGGMAQAVSERFGTHTGYRWSALAGIEPIAWMPLPEPFEPQESEEQTE